MRRIPNFLYLILPVIAWTAACSSDATDDSAGGGTGGVSAGAAGKSSTGGKGGSGSAGKAGGEATGASAGAIGQAGSGVAGAEEAGASGSEAGAAGAAPVEPTAALSDVDTIVFIYAENRSFDGLYGNFPGAHGLSEVVDAQGNPTAAYVPQKDRDGTTVLSKLPKVWGGATASGNISVVPQAMTDNLANKPFGIENAFVANGAPVLTTGDITIDLTHRFFENIMEINGGTNDMFGAWLDAGGLTMGHWDYSNSEMYQLAKDNVLADNFFEGAFGGSFLNHQYLICGCAPSIPASSLAAAVSPAAVNTLAAANAKGVPQLATKLTSPASALDGAPAFQTGHVAPLDYFGVGDGYRGVNTMQPAYQPSSNSPPAAAVGSDLSFADAALGTTVPPQTQTTLGDALTTKGVTWAWYAGAWDAATVDGSRIGAHTVIGTGTANFQTHHHPYNYFAAFSPVDHAAYRAEHLKDYNQMVVDAAAGTLPHVVYYKPTGKLNQHPSYANLDDGDAHIGEVVAKLKASPQWAHMVIVITYDEYGGQWDHVAPPKGDLMGPGTRIPALIISPYAKKGTVDHTQYDTGSLTRLVTARYGLTPLAGIAGRDAALVANGGVKMGDLTAALNVTK